MKSVDIICDDCGEVISGGYIEMTLDSTILVGGLDNVEPEHVCLDCAEERGIGIDIIAE